MLESLKKTVKKIGKLVSSLFSDLFDGISDGIDEGDIGIVARNMIALMLVVSIFLISGIILIKLVLHNAVWVVIIGLIIAGAYDAYRRLCGLEDVIEPKITKPTMDDYSSVALTVKSALKSVAPALGLAPIQGYTDIALDEEDMITKWGKVWRLGYGTLKKTAGVELDLELCSRVIQTQIKAVLTRSNPSGFSTVHFPWGGKIVPILQVDEVLQDDAYIYVLVVISSNQYFQQKAEWMNRSHVFADETDANDPLFR